MAAESEDIWFDTLNWKLKDGDIVEKHAKRQSHIYCCLVIVINLMVWHVSFLLKYEWYHGSSQLLNKKDIIKQKKDCSLFLSVNAYLYRPMKLYHLGLCSLSIYFH